MEYVHPKDHKKIAKILPSIAVVFLFVIIVGFITTKEPEHKYALSVEEIHKAVLNQNEVVSPDEALKIVASKQTGYRFVDLRNPHDFINGHIEGAVNIPLQNLLSKEYEGLWEDGSVTNILYANSHDMACGPWMLLKQLGHNNNRILLGGYQYLKDQPEANSSLPIKDYRDEAPRYDYAQIVSETAGGVSVSSKAPDKKAPPVSRKNTKSAAKGGCS